MYLLSFRKTNENGRVDSVHPGNDLESGIYKLRFETKKYFEKFEEKTFYPFAEVRKFNCYFKEFVFLGCF